MRQDYTIVVWKEHNQFVSQCLNVDVASCGDTYEEALNNAQEAAELYLEDQPEEYTPIEMPSITRQVA